MFLNNSVDTRCLFSAWASSLLVVEMDGKKFPNSGTGPLISIYFAYGPVPLSILFLFVYYNKIE